jgi:hypothetical protein
MGQEAAALSGIPAVMQDVGATELARAWPKLRQTHSGLLQEGTIPVPLLCAYGTIRTLYSCDEPGNMETKCFT